MNLGRKTPAMSSDVALNILTGGPSPVREHARESYLRTLPDEELFTWYTQSLRALLLRNPRHAALIVDLADDAAREFGVSDEQRAALRSVSS